MAQINTTINVMDQDGKLYPLNARIKEFSPVASQPAIIDEVAQHTGKGFYTGDIIKSVKRTQSDSAAAKKLGGVGGFKGASSQNMHTKATLV